MSRVNSVNQRRRPMPSRREVATYKKDAQGNYHFYGTNKNDKVSVYRRGDNVCVRINSREMVLTQEQAKNMVIHARGGEDQVVVGKGAPKGLRIRGGAGDDTMVNLGHQVSIHGGRGNDKIVSYGNDCRIRGGRGGDAIASFGFGGEVHGGNWRDHIVSNSHNEISGGRGRDQIRVTKRRRNRGFIDNIRTMLDSFFFGNVRAEHRRQNGRSRRA